mgnify:CR=1 FL=1
MTASESETVGAVDADDVRYQEAAAHVVEFGLGTETCAIDIDSVDSIVETKQITRVPRAPDAVEGVMDLRGETTAVVDPTTYLSVGDGESKENVLVLDRDEDKQKIGIRVDDVTEVVTYPEAQIDEGAQLSGIESSAIAADLVTGVIRKHVGPVDEDGVPEDVELVLWLDIDAFIRAVGERDGDPADADNHV